MQPQIPYTKMDVARVSYDEVKDLYYRCIGFAFDKQGKPQPRKFWLGHDEAAARERALHLHKAWEEIKAKGGKAWGWQGGEAADAIARGDWGTVNARAAMGAVLDVLPSRPPHAEVLASEWKAGTLPKATGEKGTGLYKALDEFSDWIRQNKLTKTDRLEDRATSLWGQNLALQVQRIKASVPDMELGQFGLEAIGQAAAYWKNRPCRKGTSQRIDSTTAVSQVKALRYFVKWLHRNPAHVWTKPDDWEEVTKCNRDEMLLDSEISELKNGIPTYSAAELGTIWTYATQWERLFVLLGMNCGFAQAEIHSLRLDEIHLDETPPTIKRIRLKSRVYGEFTLWPETAAALQWAIDNRPQASSKGKGNALAILSSKGQPLTYQRISNLWVTILHRVQRDNPQFKFLSFKFLRKSAGQFVQNFSDGETAGVFMCRGQRVRTDDLADKYTNRDFGKVFKAQAAVYQILSPVFESPTPWAGNKQRGGPNISLATIQRIKRLRKEGVKPSEIARLVNVARATVYRHA